MAIVREEGTYIYPDYDGFWKIDFGEPIGILKVPFFVSISNRRHAACEDFISGVFDDRNGWGSFEGTHSRKNIALKMNYKSYIPPPLYFRLEDKGGIVDLNCGRDREGSFSGDSVVGKYRGIAIIQRFDEEKVASKCLFEVYIDEKENGKGGRSLPWGWKHWSS